MDTNLLFLGTLYLLNFIGILLILYYQTVFMSKLKDDLHSMTDVNILLLRKAIRESTYDSFSIDQEIVYQKYPKQPTQSGPKTTDSFGPEDEQYQTSG